MITPVIAVPVVDCGVGGCQKAFAATERSIPAIVFTAIVAVVGVAGVPAPIQDSMSSISFAVFCGVVCHNARESFCRKDEEAASTFIWMMSRPDPALRITSVTGIEIA